MLKFSRLIYECEWQETMKESSKEAKQPHQNMREQEEQRMNRVET